MACHVNLILTLLIQREIQYPLITHPEKQLIFLWMIHAFELDACIKHSMVVHCPSPVTHRPGCYRVKKTETSDKYHCLCGALTEYIWSTNVLIVSVNTTEWTPKIHKFILSMNFCWQLPWWKQLHITYVWLGLSTDFFSESVHHKNNYKPLFTSSQFITNKNNNHYNMAHKKKMKTLTKESAADKALPAEAVAVASTTTVLPSDTENAASTATQQQQNNKDNARWG